MSGRHTYIYRIQNTIDGPKLVSAKVKRETAKMWYVFPGKWVHVKQIRIHGGGFYRTKKDAFDAEMADLEEDMDICRDRMDTIAKKITRIRMMALDHLNVMREKDAGR